MRKLLLLEIVFLVTIAQASSRKRLNDYILHYEELNYNTQNIHDQHRRVQRSLDSHVFLTFTSHGREFPLKLKRDKTTFSRDYKTVDDGELADHTTNFMYEGHLEKQPGSRVHGSIINGRFAGVIHAQNETFYVDKEEYHFRQPQPFHSVVYSDDDIVNNPFPSQSCGHTNHAIHGRMEQELKSAQPRNMHYRTHNIYSRATNTNGKGRTCPLYLQTDSLLWEYMKEKVLPNADDTAIKEEITAMLATHVQAIRGIYENANFVADNQDYRGITFTIRRTRINTTDDCTGQKLLSNDFCKRNLDVSTYLNLNSYQDHNEFCLAYIFTYRDFMGGTLGLAWVGSASNTAGGVCEKHRSLRDETGELIDKSTNTGIVTLINYNKPVVPKVSHLTFAHEVGHNFGSPHDDKTSECQPFSVDKSTKGNFIMFPSATSGDRDNNVKFSPCSLRNMTMVLHLVMTGQQGKRNCFVNSKTEFCGNGIQEGDEECDCGYYGDCDDACCYARDDPKHKDKMCKRKEYIECSPSQGSCCTKQCMFRNTSSTPCIFDSQCAQNSYCTGDNATCPIPAPKPDGTACNENTQLCLHGQCSGSICSRIITNGTRWEECSFSTADKTKMCYLACRPQGDNGTCYSSSGGQKLPGEFQELLANISNKEPIVLQPGATCNNLDGYCDALGKCRGVDAKGPLARLKEVFFNPDTYNAIFKWITEYWWAVVLMLIGVILLMGGFIKVCSVHTPSTNPNKPKARKLSQSLQRVANTRGRPNEGRPVALPGMSREAGPQRARKHNDERPHPSAPPPYDGPTRGYDNRYFNEFEMHNKQI